MVDGGRLQSRLDRCLCAIHWRYFLEVFKAVLAKGSSCKDRSDSGVGVEEEFAMAAKEQTRYRSNVLSLMSHVSCEAHCIMSGRNVC